MAFSIESRLPFLDHRLVEFILALPERWKIREGWTKYIQRKAIEPYLPAEVVWRRDKMGFVTPQQSWKKQLTTELIDYLEAAKVPDIINLELLIELCESNVHSTNHLSEFWRALSFVKWMELFRIRT